VEDMLAIQLSKLPVGYVQQQVYERSQFIRYAQYEEGDGYEMEHWVNQKLGLSIVDLLELDDLS
jgi:hypothetical protein